MTNEKSRRGDRKARTCGFPDCGRPLRASGLCQTHFRQQRTTGKLKPIRPYRERRKGTVKFAGLRLSQTCAGQIDQKATREGVSRGAAITRILEEWFERNPPEG